MGALVPNDFDRCVRIGAPDSERDDWWTAYQPLYELIAGVAATQTTTPSSTWFAVWDGHGWDTASTLYASSEPLTDAERRELETKQAQLQEQDRVRRLAVRAGLAAVPRFEMPHRAYCLVGGPATAVGGLRDPVSPDRWQRPDLMWPDDRAWFVATDVDFWSLYVGGTIPFVDALAEIVPTSVEPVTLDQLLELED